MTKITIEIDETDVKKLVLAHLSGLSGIELKLADIHIQTKSKQNYKAEWESASFRAHVEVTH